MQATNLSSLGTVPAGHRTSTSSKQFHARHTRGLGEPQQLPSSALTMAQWLDEWLELCALRGLRPAAVPPYHPMARLHLSGALAAVPPASFGWQDLHGPHTPLPPA